MSLRTTTPREGRWYPNLAGIAEPQVEQAIYRAFDYIHQLKANTIPRGAPIPVSTLVGENIPGGIVTAISRGLRTGGVAPLNLSLLPGVPVDAKKLIGDAQSFTTTVVFSATDEDTVAWTAGTLTLSDGTSFAISSGNTGNMAAITFIYFDSNASLTTLQTSLDPDDSVGPGRRYLASAIPTADATQEATFIPVVGTMGFNETNIGPNSISTGLIQARTIQAGDIAVNTLTATEIAALTITGAQIAATTITSDKINVSQLDAISADVGELTAGTITGLLYRTASSGDRLEIFTGAVPLIQWINGATTIGDIIRAGNGLVFEVVNSSATANLSITTAHASSSVIISVNAITTASFNRNSIDFFQDLDMNTDDILNVGNIELDSITKDGAGNIAVNDIFDMLGNSIINIGDVECDSLTKDGAGDIGVNDHFDMNGNHVLECAQITPVSDDSGTVGTAALTFGTAHLLNIICSSLTAVNGTNIVVDDHLDPNSDNVFRLGTASKRYSDLRSVLINGADIGFENDWKFREWPCTALDIHDKKPQWFKEHANLGIQLLDENDELKVVFHRDGYVYAKGVRTLEELNE